jgi:putative ABC transport system ATP-binding protein
VLEVSASRSPSDAGTPLSIASILSVAAGEWVAIVGESGSGKSTLLNIVAGLDRPDAGEVRLDGSRSTSPMTTPSPSGGARNLGFVFQAFHLLPYLDVGENVALPLRPLGAARANARARCGALARVGLAGSGAQARRRSPAARCSAPRSRARWSRPRLILADEPTGNLDEARPRRCSIASATR